MEIRIKHEIYARIVGLCTINRIKRQAQPLEPVFCRPFVASAFLNYFFGK